MKFASSPTSVIAATHADENPGVAYVGAEDVVEMPSTEPLAALADGALVVLSTVLFVEGVVGDALIVVAQSYELSVALL
ncbi:hypothetical protein PF010_g11730 [Phytophthora fragariae]|uniref:Uncharacterized protein n=1 Tax=Phytophthora fragariae TaxID=53985 RepID=A0A6A3KPW3_9STRA|nr:hypothetical protein PF011_g10310 [Phytophthora fragariae]KAE9108908.1 hypothetical protein PF010_g11730 [Phytophthora fragariae]